MPKLILMMKKTILVPALALLLPVCGMAQYYYKDILSNVQLTADMQSYKNHKVRKINIKSLEADGTPGKDFFCKRNISRDYRSVETGTRSLGSTPSLSNSFFNENGALTSLYDSSAISVTHIDYSYDKEDRISSIISVITSRDDDYVTSIREEHHYEYGASGKPARMVRIMNGKDSSIILFSLDEKNNVNLEKNTSTGNVYYYYFDEENRLTDIVRESKIHGRMMPDYLFAYDGQGRLEKMMSTEEGSSNYSIWKYEYDDRGLRSKESIYSKEKRLLGTLEYDYQ